MTAELLLLWVGAYILGAIPFGVLITRSKAGIDITKLGSGNIGATNVHRILGAKYSIPVLALDIAKGLIPPVVAQILKLSWEPSLSVIDVALIAGFIAVLGHCASPFLKFRGGKGVATICGAAIGATPAIALVGITAFILVTAVTRYISLASIVAVIVATITACLLRFDGLVIGGYAAIMLFIIFKHRANIRRLLKGEESKFNFRGGKGLSGDSDPPKEVNPARNSKSEMEQVSESR